MTEVWTQGSSFLSAANLRSRESIRKPGDLGSEFWSRAEWGGTKLSSPTLSRPIHSLKKSCPIGFKGEFYLRNR